MTESGRYYLKWFWLCMLLFNLIMIFLSTSVGTLAHNPYYYNSTLYQKAMVFIWGIGEITIILLYTIFALKYKMIVLRR